MYHQGSVYPPHHTASVTCKRWTLQTLLNSSENLSWQSLYMYWHDVSTLGQAGKWPAKRKIPGGGKTRFRTYLISICDSNCGVICQAGVLDEWISAPAWAAGRVWVQVQVHPGQSATGRSRPERHQKRGPPRGIGGMDSLKHCQCVYPGSCPITHPICLSSEHSG